MHWLAYAGTDQVHVNCSDCGWALLNACRWLNLNLDGVRAHRDRDLLGPSGIPRLEVSTCVSLAHTSRKFGFAALSTRMCGLMHLERRWARCRVATHASPAVATAVRPVAVPALAGPMERVRAGFYAFLCEVM